MFVGILLCDSARDFGVEFESWHHRKIFKSSLRSQTVKKLLGATLNMIRPKVKAQSFWGHVKLITNEFLKGKIYM